MTVQNCLSLVPSWLSCLIADRPTSQLYAGAFLGNDKFISSQRRAKGYVKTRIIACDILSAV